MPNSRSERFEQHCWGYYLRRYLARGHINGNGVVRWVRDFPRDRCRVDCNDLVDQEHEADVKVALTGKHTGNCEAAADSLIVYRRLEYGSNPSLSAIIFPYHLVS